MLKLLLEREKTGRSDKIMKKVFQQEKKQSIRKKKHVLHEIKRNKLSRTFLLKKLDQFFEDGAIYFVTIPLPDIPQQWSYEYRFRLSNPQEQHKVFYLEKTDYIIYYVRTPILASRHHYPPNTIFQIVLQGPFIMDVQSFPPTFDVGGSLSHSIS